MAVSLAISEILSVKESSDLEIWVWGRSRSLKMARFDRPCMTVYWSAIVTTALSCTVFDLFDVEIWVRGLSGSGSQVSEILATYVIAFLRHWANALYEPWAGQ